MRILVIEDNLEIAAALKQRLEQESFVVDVTPTGEEGLDLAATMPYDIILLDAMLPKMNGTDICSEIRFLHVDTPILFLTTQDFVADQITSQTTNADDGLTKPYAFEELLAHIHALAQRPAGMLDTELTAGFVSLNVLRHQVLVRNEELPLTLKEFTVLEYLLRHQGRAVSKLELGEHIRNTDVTISPHTIETTVSSLQHKLSHFPGGLDVIQTLPEASYRID